MLEPVTGTHSQNEPSVVVLQGKENTHARDWWYPRIIKIRLFNITVDAQFQSIVDLEESRTSVDLLSFTGH